MLILSQNKDVLTDDINISIVTSRFDGESYVIKNKNDTLGVYKTKEQAHAVICDIAKRYDYLHKQNNDDSKYMFYEDNVYYMPENNPNN